MSSSNDPSRATKMRSSPGSMSQARPAVLPAASPISKNASRMRRACGRMKSRAKRQTRAAERPPIPTIAGSIRMGFPALLEPGTGVGKRGARVASGHLRGTVGARGLGGVISILIIIYDSGIAWLSHSHREPNALALRFLSAENSQWNSARFAVISSGGDTEVQQFCGNWTSLPDISLRKQQEQPGGEPRSAATQLVKIPIDASENRRCLGDRRESRPFWYNIQFDLHCS